ncbi:MAG: PKD-like family lipoprotein [Rikenellaceae bacterium]|nr:PKD-like family lipoprotein [Rikenellaceae bacterium]
MKVKFFIISVAAFFITACYVDKGNYDYTTISDISITGIESNYSKIAASDTLRITPKIESTYNESDFEYTWVIYDRNNKCDTLGKERNLNYPVKNAPGTYTIFYYVKNKSNTYYRHAQTALTVSTQYSLGHYILKETPSGNTDFDILLNDGKLITDVLLKTQGASMSGAPESMGILYNKMLIDPLTMNKSNSTCIGIISSNNNYSIFRTSDMCFMFNKDNLFYDKNSLTPYKFVTFKWTDAFITNMGVYADYNIEAGSGILGFPNGVAGGSRFWAYATTLTGLVYWDETNNRLLYTNYNATAYVLSNTLYPTTNYKCLFMGSYKGTIYALFKDKTDSKVYLYTITTKSTSRPPVISTVKEISSAMKFSSASMYGSNERSAQFIYFVENNKPFYYDVTSDTEHELSFENLPLNEIITYISNRYDRNASPKTDYLTIATQNSNSYHIYMYNMVGGLPLGAPERTVAGTGKVKETHFVNYTYDMDDDYYASRGYDYGYSR